VTPGSVQRFPLAWPAGWVRTPGSDRKRGAFNQKRTDGIGIVSISVIRATERLERELSLLGGDYATLSTNIQLRLDGRPYSDRGEPGDPGAAIYFTFKGRATVFACDRYRRVADNIAAIAGHVEALRAIQRFGVGSIEQALAGYKALPSDTAADWRTVFGFPADSRPALDAVDVAFKRLAHERHPDKPGGSAEAMQHLNRARDFATDELTK
jgi:hypothetical protein